MADDDLKQEARSALLRAIAEKVASADSSQAIQELAQAYALVTQLDA